MTSLRARGGARCACLAPFLKGGGHHGRHRRGEACRARFRPLDAPLPPPLATRHHTCPLSCLVSRRSVGVHPPPGSHRGLPAGEGGWDLAGHRGGTRHRAPAHVISPPSGENGDFKDGRGAPAGGATPPARGGAAWDGAGGVVWRRRGRGSGARLLAASRACRAQPLAHRYPGRQRGHP